MGLCVAATGGGAFGGGAASGGAGSRDGWANSRALGGTTGGLVGVGRVGGCSLRAAGTWRAG